MGEGGLNGEQAVVLPEQVSATGAAMSLTIPTGLADAPPEAEPDVLPQPPVEFPANAF
jgi:hypothetical protein